MVVHPAFTGEARTAYPDLVVYTVDEIKELRRHVGNVNYPQMVTAVHVLKRRFGGAVLPATRDRHRRAERSATQLVACESKPREGIGAGVLVDSRHGDTQAVPLAMVTTDGGRGSGSPDRTVPEGS